MPKPKPKPFIDYKFDCKYKASDGCKGKTPVSNSACAQCLAKGKKY